MKSAPIPINEKARLEALYRYNVLDTPADLVLDELTELAADLCNAPVATITLIDNDREWYKSKIGIEDTQAPRDISFCAHTILQDDLMIVPDTFKDERFSDNPFVLEDPPLRFYAGAPLITPGGHAIGTLCVIDHVPRRLRKHQKKALKILAHNVITSLDLYRTTSAQKRAEKALQQSRDELEDRVNERTAELLDTNRRLHEEILERQELENALKSSRARLELALESAEMGAWDWNMLTGKIIWNREHEKLFGIELDQFEGTYESFEQQVHPDDLMGLNDALQQAIINRQRFSHIFRIFWPDGSIHWIEGVGQFVFNETELPVNMHGVTMDITERILAEQTLHEALARYQTLFQQSPDAVVIIDPKTTLPVEFNDKTLELLGYSREEFKKLPISKYDLNENPEEIRQHVEKITKQGGDLFETRMRTKDDQIKHIIVNLKPIELQGQLLIHNIFHDITQRKIAEEALREGDKHFNALFDQNVVGVAKIDSKTGRFIMINQRYCNIVGYTHDEMLQMDFQAITFPEDLQADLDSMLQLRAGEISTYQMEKRYFHKDGSVVWVSLTVMPLWEKGSEPDFHLAIIEDISRRKQTESDLKFASFAIDHAADGIYWIRPDGSFFYVNDAACNSLGYSRDEMMSMSIPDIDPDSTIDKLSRDWAIIKENKFACFELRHRTRDGRIFPVEVQSNYLQYEGKEYTCAIVRDISERKQVEETLLFNQFAIDNFSDAAFWTAQDAKFVYVNKAACQSLGYSKEELLNMSIWDIDPDFSSDRWVEYWQSTRHKSTITFETTHQRKDGTIFPADIRINYLVYQGKEYHCSFARDITKLKQAEATLHESRRMLTTLMDNLPGMVYRCKNDKHWSLEFGSEGMRELTGRPVEDFITGRIHFSQIIHPDDQQPVWDKIQVALDKRKPFELEYRIQHANGAERWVWEHGLGVFDNNGQLLALEGVIIDVTHSKKADLILERAHRALSVLSGCNHAMLHAKSEVQLLSEICRIIVKTGNYRLAWVGYAEQDDNKSVRPVAHWGYEKGYIDSLNITWADEERGHGPTGNAIRNGKSYVARNIHTEPNFTPWRKAALERGYESSIAIPLMNDGHVFGALMIYAHEPDAFNTKEIHLLEDLAKNLTFGLTALRTEIKRVEVEHNLEQSEEHLRFLYEENPTMYYTLTLDGTVLSVNEFGANALGYTVKELTGHSIFRIMQEKDHETIQMHLKICLENFGQLHEWEVQKLHKKGRKVWMKDSARVVDTPDGNAAILIVSRDITKRRLAEEKLKRNHMISQSLLKLESEYISSAIPGDFFNNLLSILISVTNSEYGFIGEILHNEKGPPSLETRAIINIPWNKEIQRYYEDMANAGLENTNLNNLFGTVLKSGKTVMTNDAKNGPPSSGLPHGHPALDSFLKLPIYLGKEMIGMAGIANRPSGYNMEMAQELQPLLYTCANIIEGHRNNEKRLQIEGELRDNEIRLKNAQRIAHLGFWEWDIVTGEVYWSEEVYRIFNIRPGEIEINYKVFLNAIHPDDQDHVEECINNALNKRMDYSNDHRIILPDGVIRYVYDQGEVSFDETGKPVRMVGTVADITERKQTEQKLQKSREQMRKLATRLQAVREEERTLIAREIHDELGQTLTGLKMDLSWIHEHMPANLKKLPVRVDAMISLVDAKLEDIRKLAFRLRPAMLDDLGLEAAIECEVQDFSERADCDYSLDLNNGNLVQNRDRDTALFRILQESLTNVARHAKASRVDVALHASSSELVLTIRDNGVGIDQNKITNSDSLGLIGMHERAGALDGQINIKKINEGGTQVSVIMPIGSNTL